MGWAFAPDVQRKIEQVGSGYEKLKVRYAKLAQKMSENSASAHFSDEEEEDK